MSGADVSALASLAAAMGEASDHLARLRAGLAAQVHSIYWEGPDAEAVRLSCRTEWEPMLSAAAQLLDRARADLDRQVRQQVDASGAAQAGTHGPWGNLVPMPWRPFGPGHGSTWKVAIDPALDQFRRDWADALPREGDGPGGLHILPYRLEPHWPERIALPDSDVFVDWTQTAGPASGGQPS
jgi:hypothetical protein